MSKGNSSEPEESAIENFTQLIEGFIDFMATAEHFDYGEIRRRKTRFLIEIHALEGDVIREGMAKGSSFADMSAAYRRGLILCQDVANEQGRRIYTVKQGGTPEHIENLKEDMREMIRQNRDHLKKCQEQAKIEKAFLLTLRPKKGSNRQRWIQARIAALDGILLEVIHYSEDAI